MSIHGYVGNIITANPTAPTSTVASGVWTTEQQLAAKSAGNWPFTIPTQQIGSSLRFNPADSAYLNRTLGSSNRRTFTFSAWVKRSLLTSDQHLLGCIDLTGGNNRQFGIVLQGGDYLTVFHYNNGTYQYYPTAALYRDTSAWYHFVVAVDTTQATGLNRAKIYVNGVLQATNGAVDFTQNTDLFINSGLNTGIGTQVGTGTGNSYFFGGYMAEVYFVDGQALTPSSFGRTSTTTGVWEPIAYSGTYGTNGFFLNFSDNSGTTSTTLGKDYSGNGNNWTPNNFSVTAGAGNDSMVDSPAAYGTDTGVGGSVRGNYATLNPLARNSGTLANGNLDFSTGATYQYGSGTIAIPSSGKWIFEVTFNTTPTINNYNSCGVVTSSFDRTGSFTSTGAYGVEDVSTFGQRFVQNGVPQGSITMPAGTVIQCLIDRDAGTLTFTKNGTLQTGTGSTVTLPASSVELFAVVGQYSNSVTANFGQRAFAYTAPSGFKALCTTNLPTPTIGATSTTLAGKYFNPVIYTGTGSTRTVTGVGFQPDFTWIKPRSSADHHILYDAIRGVRKQLYTNLTNAEETETQGLSAFTSDGFTVNGAHTVRGQTNDNTVTYVAWNWNAGGSTVTNTSGTISAQVRASTISGVSIITYTGNGTAGATVGHGLGVTPDMIIVKSRSVGTGDWVVWHSSLTSSNNNYLLLNSTAAVNTANQPWNNTLPTSSVFSLRTWDSVNQNGSTYVAYCFDAVAGYSAFGSYTGNGSTDGPFVYLGFRPEFVMIKNATSAGSSWEMFDNARETSNLMDLELLANSSNAEGTYTYGDFVSNGFKLRSTNNGVNQSSATLIYMAFAENPFKYALAR